LDVLISPSSQEETDIKYNGMNMGAIQILLDFMEKRIDKVWTAKILHKRDLFDLKQKMHVCKAFCKPFRQYLAQI